MIEPVIIGRATLYCADARDVLPTLPLVDAVVTDPPYGDRTVRNHDGHNTSRGVLAQARDYGKSEWDSDPISPELMALVKAAGRWSVIFGGNYYDCPPASCWLVWDKLNGANDFADCELAWTNLPKAVRRIAYRWHGMIREKGAQRGDHPTQKPLEVMKWCISHLPTPNETILDPFAGSGTTGVAAIQLGKAFIGIEREERYFEAMCRRLREANGDDLGPLFEEQAA